MTSVLATSSAYFGLTDSAKCSVTDFADGPADSVNGTADGPTTEAADNFVTDAAFSSVGSIAAWTANASSSASSDVLAEGMLDWQLIWALPLATLPE